MWKTRDGREMRLSEMSCEHLRNSLNKIFRDKWRTQWISSILAELDRRCKPKQPSETKQKETENA